MRLRRALSVAVVAAASMAAVVSTAPGGAEAAELTVAKKILGPLMAAPLAQPVEAPTLVETQAAEEPAAAPAEEAEEEESAEVDSADIKDDEESDAEEESGAESSEGSGGVIAASDLQEKPPTTCAEYNKQQECIKTTAKIVTSLSHDYRPFKDTSKPIGESSGAQALNDLPEDERNDHGDAVLQGLFKKLIATEDTMKSERDWVTKVYQLIDHYREKALRVRGDIRHKGGVVYKLEQMIHARQKELTDGALKEKLKTVNAAMAELESKTGDVEKHQKFMLETKNLLKNRILGIRHELAKIGAPVYSS